MKGDHIENHKGYYRTAKKVGEPELWMEELELDSRTGVQNALNRWKRHYEKRKVIEQMHEAKEAFDASMRRSMAQGLRGWMKREEGR